MKYSKNELVKMFEQMLTGRRYEEKVMELVNQGKIGSFYHLGIGQEAVGVGVMNALGSNDYFQPTHRSHPALLCRLDMKKMTAELLGRSTGYNGGKASTIHITSTEDKVLPSNGILGANIPLTTGFALGMKLDKNGVVVCVIGDGAFYKLRLENEKQAIVNSIEQLSVGLIILDGKFSLLHSNKTAQEYCMDIANKSSSNSLIHVINLLSLEYYGKSLRTTFDIKSYTFNITSILVPSEGMGIESVYCVYIMNQQDAEDSSIDVDESLYTLTHREKEIIILMAKGYSDKDIAKSLYLSTHTVRTHFKNIFRKMDASSRTEVLYKLNNMKQKKLFISSSK